LNANLNELAFVRKSEKNFDEGRCPKMACR
jgi:hypothetical protein